LHLKPFLQLAGWDVHFSIRVLQTGHAQQEVSMSECGSR
jgi:hypothetical protein